MTPDDAPIPSFDRVARAARQGLGDLARSGAPAELSWSTVVSGARRVQRRRIAAVSAAVAVVLLANGVAVAATRTADGHLRVNGTSPTTKTEETTSSTTTTVDLPTTTITTGTAPGDVGSTTTIPFAQTSGLEGELTLASTTLVAEQPTTFILTMRNTTDLALRIADHFVALGVWIAAPAYSDFDPPLLDLPESTLAAGETRTFRGEITPAAQTVGPASVHLALVPGGWRDNPCYCMSAGYIDEIPPVPVTIVPPGWVEGEPLDPSRGSWNASLTSDAPSVHVGEPFVIHARVRNTGNQPQRTRGYGALTIVCYRQSYAVEARSIEAAMIDAGGQAEFTVEFLPTAASEGDLSCSLQLTFHDKEFLATYPNPIETDAGHIKVLPASEPTTTTVSDTTTSTTP